MASMRLSIAAKELEDLGGMCAIKAKSGEFSRETSLALYGAAAAFYALSETDTPTPDNVALKVVHHIAWDARPTGGELL